MSPSFVQDAKQQLGLRSIALGFLLAISLQSAAFYISFSKVNAASWVVHTIEVETEINYAFSLIQELETGQRGYLLTRDDKYLVRFNDALKDLKLHLTILANQVQDNPDQIKNVARLDQLSSAKVIELSETINTAKNNDFEGALAIVRTDRGKEIMNEIRSLVNTAIELENQLLDQRIETYERYIQISRLLSVGGLIVALCLLIVVARRGYVLINKSLKNFIEYRDARDEELVLAREKAEDGEKAKSQFLASMSHEIRTPMTGVFGLTEMLAKTSMTGEQQEIVDSMRSTNRMLNTVINDILEYSRIEAGKLPIEKMPFDLRAIIEDVTSTFHPSAVEKGIHFDTSFDDDIPSYVMGDPTRVRQVLFNLVANAIKFTGEGHVHIDVISADDDHVEFTVADTGEGISDEGASHLFQAFEQADNSVSRKHGGTGLGLAICKNLVELMGGEISVSSDLGVGSTFRFRIPLPVAVEPRGVEKVQAEPKDNTLKPMKILVAEDVEISQVIIESILTGEGHSCRFANDGEQAVDAVQSDDYDLVLMDIRMPNVDGVEAFKRIRAIDSKRCRLPIVALTADIADGQISKFLKVGFDGVASKPIDSNKLFAIINQAMHSKNLQANAEQLEKKQAS